MHRSGISIDYLFKKEIGDFKVLSHEEVLKLAYQNDNEARTKLIEHNIKLVFSIADAHNRYHNSAIDFHDLVQEGIIGLIKAVEKYDPAKGYRFATYATWWIRQYIKRALYKHRYAIGKPEYLLVMEDKISKSTSIFIRQNGRYPTEEEIAQMTELSQEDVHDVLLHRHAVVSLDNIVYSDNKEKTYKDWLVDDSYPIDELLLYKEELENICLEIKHTLSKLKIRSERNKDLFKERYGFYDGLLEIKSLEDVGRKYPISRERVRQILEKIWEKIGKDDEWFCIQIDRVREFEDAVGDDASRIFLNVI